MSMPWEEPTFAWDICPASKLGFHSWHELKTRFHDGRHRVYECFVCRASGTYTNLEMARYWTLIDERLAAQRRGNGGRK